MGSSRSQRRRRTVLSAAFAGGLGGLSGCLQPLLEAGEEDESDQADGDSDEQTADEEQTVHVDDVSLTESATIDTAGSLRWVTAVDDEFYFQEEAPPDGEGWVNRVDIDGTVDWESERVSRDEYELLVDGPIDTDGSLVYVGADSYHTDQDGGRLYAFDFESGQSEWHYDAAETGHEDVVWELTASDDGVVYGVGSHGSGSDQQPRVGALDASGTELWDHQFDEGFVTGLAVYDGTVYTAASNELIAYDLASGDKLETYSVTPTFDALAYEGSELYVADDFGNALTRFDMNRGEQRWSTETVQDIESRPTVGIEVVCVGAEAGYVLAYDRETGDTRWETRLEGSVATGPVAEDGLVWVTDEQQDLYALEERDGDIRHHRTLTPDYDEGELQLAVTDGVLATEAEPITYSIER
ncbi:PQQ-binding-like beta-propeller repeat protein [Natrialbaceae archaeon AArc-T1-2]|uniref:PQQ-binding-like beta-propeller repeat protein n=1 Tax=Natrialbaceae archaeon AArc-T1-2 TaxID=3053904 RepID=UPI00255A7368|nr:PQQ-binding-like beta-propeller repeat protein [Natrialbaceae archaeon AArc-T1-2]WIV68810.1 PQQ-like beta-propeller repeat protein [Natrialbaceae archaeon AArc-T1-2]